MHSEHSAPQRTGKRKWETLRLHHSVNTTGKLASRIQINQTFVGEEPGDQRSYIVGRSIPETSVGVDLRALKTELLD
jgi:hypothetical protein